ASDAVAPAALAHRQRGLRADRVHPVGEQADRPRRLDELRDAAQGADAEPRRVHPPLPGEDPVALYFSSPALRARWLSMSMAWPMLFCICSMVFLPCSSSCFLSAAAVAAVLAVSTPQPASAAAASKANIVLMAFSLSLR